MLFGGETANSYYEEGLTAVMKGDNAKALAHFKRALELNTLLHNARRQLGKCLLRQGDIEQALGHLRTAVKMTPDSAAPLLDYGFALVHARKLDEATSAFSEALRLNENEPKAVLGLAYCAFFREQWTTAVNLVYRVMEMGRNQFDAYYLLVRAADKANMLEVSAEYSQKAVELMNNSIETVPDQVPAHYLRGRVYFDLNNYSLALVDFDAALAHAGPDDAYLAYNELFAYVDLLAMKAECLRRLNRGAEADAVDETLRNLAPKGKEADKEVEAAHNANTPGAEES